MTLGLQSCCSAGTVHQVQYLQGRAPPGIDAASQRRLYSKCKVIPFVSRCNSASCASGLRIIITAIPSSYSTTIHKHLIVIVAKLGPRNATATAGTSFEKTCLVLPMRWHLSTGVYKSCAHLAVIRNSASRKHTFLPSLQKSKQAAVGIRPTCSNCMHLHHCMLA